MTSCSTAGRNKLRIEVETTFSVYLRMYCVILAENFFIVTWFLFVKYSLTEVLWILCVFATVNDTRYSTCHGFDTDYRVSRSATERTHAREKRSKIKLTNTHSTSVTSFYVLRLHAHILFSRQCAILLCTRFSWRKLIFFIVTTIKIIFLYVINYYCGLN